MLTGIDLALKKMECEHNVEMKREVEERILHRIAKVHDLLEMWHGSQNVPAMQKESSTQNMQISAVRYISVTDEIVRVSWSNFGNNGEAACILLEQ